MNLDAWGLFLGLFMYGMTMFGDWLLLLTFGAAGVIFIGRLVSIAAENHQMPKWAQRWDAFITGFVLSVIGIAAKLGDTSGLPIGAVFQFNIPIAIGILLVSLALVVTALVMPRRYSYY